MQVEVDFSGKQIDNDPVILRSQADWLHLYTYKTGINIEINYFDFRITRKIV